MAEPPFSAPELLNASHDVSQFSCGKPSLDHWLKTRALANQQKGFTVVMVVHVAGRVVGYYGLALTAIVAATLANRRTRCRAFCSDSWRQILPGPGKGSARDCSTTRWPAASAVPR
jgi:hypothetical protein